MTHIRTGSIIEPGNQAGDMKKTKTKFGNLDAITIGLLAGLLACAPLYSDDGDYQHTAIAEIDAVFADFDGTDVPGCALGVIQDGEFVYKRGYGMANLEYGIPIDSSSVFRIASTSKQFAATAIALLARKRQLSLDDPVSKFFPEFPAWSDDMTVMQLINHSSGIRDYLTLAYLAGFTNDAEWYNDAWVLNLLARQQETNFPAGSEYLYSNSQGVFCSVIL